MPNPPGALDAALDASRAAPSDSTLRCAHCSHLLAGHVGQDGYWICLGSQCDCDGDGPPRVGAADDWRDTPIDARSRATVDAYVDAYHSNDGHIAARYLRDRTWLGRAIDRIMRRNTRP